ncbi:hypothetical protein [Niveispirillum cyanobacteriorum]|uniref:Uncharacterized protein n=1 Tax=Niveispirillum cyanobacteriorum TaxID=1612173 RepID=A0A2K9NFQ4_9PROT|nr:hypothetical protein [Niveispirillum cyanobacteriorum]AUN31960.1 hypothetical protein C0V82_16150 [Niveispirillum cyanobacteriorum]
MNVQVMPDIRVLEEVVDGKTMYVVWVNGARASSYPNILQALSFKASLEQRYRNDRSLLEDMLKPSDRERRRPSAREP